MEKIRITIINGVEISAVRDENKEIFVPVKPICQALGIDFASQYNKLQSDETLGAVIAIIATTGADGKTYEMVCLPLKFIYGWLFTINPGKVAPEARETVIRYRLECYEVLYGYFSGQLRRRLEENEAEINALEELNRATANEKTARAERIRIQQKLETIRKERLNPNPYLDL